MARVSNTTERTMPAADNQATSLRVALNGWDAAIQNEKKGNAASPDAAKGFMRLAQDAAPMPGFPLAPPLPPQFIPGAKENKQLTEPLARAIDRHLPGLADRQTVLDRLDYLRRAGIAASAKALLLGFPEKLDRSQSQPHARDVDPAAPAKMAARPWHCTASCNVENFSNIPNAPARVTGSATGPSEYQACENAKRDATQNAPRGTYARHCQCRCSK